MISVLATVNGWWALARASGLAAWLFVVASLVLGALAAGRMVPARGATRWLLDMHPWISTLGLALVGLHIVALLGDSYVNFDLASVLVPFAASWRPLAVSWGVVAFWLLLAIEGTSIIRRWMPKSAWHKVHLASYGVAVLVTIHALTAGSDLTNNAVRFSLVGIAAVALIVSAMRARQAALAADDRAWKAALAAQSAPTAGDSRGPVGHPAPTLRPTPARRERVPDRSARTSEWGTAPTWPGSAPTSAPTTPPPPPPPPPPLRLFDADRDR